MLAFSPQRWDPFQVARAVSHDLKDPYHTLQVVVWAFQCKENWGSHNCFEPRSPESNKLMSMQAFFHARGFRNLFVWMSAAIFAVISYIRTKRAFLKSSCRDVLWRSRLFPSKCRIGGVLPDLISHRSCLDYRHETTTWAMNLTKSPRCSMQEDP